MTGYSEVSVVGEETSTSLCRYTQPERRGSRACSGFGVARLKELEYNSVRAIGRCMSERQQLAATILLLLTTTCQMMDGCSTVVIAPRCDQSWRNGEVVFLGKAISQLGGEKQLGNGTIELTDYEFHFVPVEIFRGVSKGAKEVVVYTGHGMGDCSEPFVVGASYLVYARSVNGLLKAWTGTMQETMAGGALRELRAIARGERADDLFGTIGVGKPLANVVVRAIGHHGVRFSAKTDDNGAYGFASLPKGRYRIEADSPTGLLLGEFPAYVKTRKQGGTGCRVDAFRPFDEHGSAENAVAEGRGH